MVCLIPNAFLQSLKLHILSGQLHTSQEIFVYVNHGVSAPLYS
jgi:hypothetical protein